MMTSDVVDQLDVIHEGLEFINSRYRRRREVYTVKARRAGIGLEWPSYLTLRALANGPLSVKDLALICGVKHSTMSRQVARLLRQGLVAKASDKADRRRVLLLISPEGIVLLTQIGSAREDALREMLRDWSPTEVSEFARGLSHFSKSVERFYREHADLVPDVKHVEEGPEQAPRTVDCPAGVP